MGKTYKYLALISIIIAIIVIICNDYKKYNKQEFEGNIIKNQWIKLDKYNLRNDTFHLKNIAVSDFWDNYSDDDESRMRIDPFQKLTVAVFPIGKYWFSIVNLRDIANLDKYPALKNRGYIYPPASSEIENRVFQLVFIDTTDYQVTAPTDGMMLYGDFIKIRQTDLFTYISYLHEGDFARANQDTLFCNSGLILMKNSVPTDIHRHIFSNEEIHIVQKKGNYLRVVTNKLIFASPIKKQIERCLIGHTPTMLMVSTDEFNEYLFDDNLNLISKKLLETNGNEELRRITESDETKKY